MSEESAFGEFGGWPVVLARLFAREDLSASEAALAFGEVLAGRAQDSQIGAFLAALRTKGETIEEMTGFVGAMRAHVEPVVITADAIDTCGTGGDRSGTINVSTVAAFVAAGAGAVVCKHGNRAQSSQAGSADVLEALGVAIDLGPRGVARCVEEAGIGFCLAPRFHPAMRHAGPVRRELGVATVFNFLGPLANPAGVRRQVVGVGDPAMAEKMLGVLAATGARHAMVVYGHDGLDELTTVTSSRIQETFLDADGWRTGRDVELDPRSLGLSAATRTDLLGGDAATNATHARDILDGTRGPKRDIVVLNAAAALVAAGVAADLEDGVARAGESIDEGRAASVLDTLVRVSRKASASSG